MYCILKYDRNYGHNSRTIVMFLLASGDLKEIQRLFIYLSLSGITISRLRNAHFETNISLKIRNTRTVTEHAETFMQM